jgi:ABC-type branched-subunit amino acid transport system permease subunit
MTLNDIAAVLTIGFAAIFIVGGAATIRGAFKSGGFPVWLGEVRREERPKEFYWTIAYNLILIAAMAALGVSAVVRLLSGT